MSRSWRKSGPADWSEKARPRPRSQRWQQARAARAERRQNVAEQSRDSQGFILRKQADGHAIMFDPGVIDRYIWVRNNGEA